MDMIRVVQVAQIAAPFVVGGGIVLGIVQLREFQRQRRAAAAVELVHSFRNVEFNKALRIIWAIPDSETATALRARGTECEEAAILVGTTVEVVGVLVYRRVVPIEIVDDLMGDAIVGFWPKLRDWVEAMRREQDRESVYEWFQWLVDRLETRERRRTRGAHSLFSEWQP
ncbi:MAG: hypothetical protein ACKVU1_02320 [bacterium]